MSSVIIRKKAILEFGVGLCLLIGICIFSFLSVTNLDNAMSWVKHTYIVKLDLAELESELRSAESHQRGYLLTSKDFYLTDFYVSLEQVQAMQYKLMRETTNNPEQTKRLQGLSKTIEERLNILKSVLEMKQSGQDKKAQEIVNSSRGRLSMISLLEQSRDIKNVEDTLLDERLQKQSQIQQTTVIFIIFGGVISIVITFGAMTIINNFNYTNYS